jgi:hypothetical protein
MVLELQAMCFLASCFFFISESLPCDWLFLCEGDWLWPVGLNERESLAEDWLWFKDLFNAKQWYPRTP